MEEPVATPRPPVSLFKRKAAGVTDSSLLSSSPGFGTPAYPIVPRNPPNSKPAFSLPANSNSVTTPTVLPISIPPQTLRPVAFRTLTKKHNLTLTTSGLGLLSTFIGKFCGTGWREEGLAERVLDEIAKAWRRGGGGIIIEDGPDKKLSNILKSLEPCMSGGRVEVGRLSRTTSSLNASGLSRQNSLGLRPQVGREDSQASLGISGLDLQDSIEIEQEEDESASQNARSYIKLISAFSQPQFEYSTTKKTLQPSNRNSSLLPPIQSKINMFRNRYHLVHQRLMRNESFQASSFSTTMGHPSLIRSGSSALTLQQAYKITPISNLLGRSGTSHLLLGMLVNSALGDLALTDLSGSVVLEMSVARPIPEDGAWFCPGMMVLIEGVYEEDGSNNSNLGSVGGVGGQIKGRFIAETIAGPPAERRDVTIGTGENLKSQDSQTSVGAGFGWIDFLGVGSNKAVGSQMRRLQKRLFGSAHDEEAEPKQSKIIMIAECHLDSPRTLEAIRAILNSYNAIPDPASRPLSIVFMGNFVSAASCAESLKGGGSVEYKEYFDGLASVLSEFPTILSTTSFVFVPGDNDPWASTFSAGASVMLPRQSIPNLFTSRIKRAIATANTEASARNSDSPGEAIWTSNPARLSLFGPVHEVVLFRDDMTGRMRRNSIMFSKPQEEDKEMERDSNQSQIQADRDEERSVSEHAEADSVVHEAASHIPRSADPTVTNGNSKVHTALARKLVKTILDQGHLAPFTLSTRPVLWDYSSSLSLYPLPTAMVLADAEAPPFALTYEGCQVMNPGRLLDDLGARKGLAKWMEYDFRIGKGAVQEIRF